MAKPSTILAFDPGKSWDEETQVGSFAYAVMREDHIIQHGLLIPFSSLTDNTVTQALMFSARIQALLTQFKPDIVVIERFQDRGGASKGTTGEFVNLMIGNLQLTMAQANCELTMIMPSQWKTWLTRTHEIGKKSTTKNIFEYLKVQRPEAFLAKGKNKVPKGKRMVIHEGDAIGIALWAYQVKLGGQVRLERLLLPEAVRVIL